MSFHPELLAMTDHVFNNFAYRYMLQGKNDHTAVVVESDQIVWRLESKNLNLLAELKSKKYQKALANGDVLAFSLTLWLKLPDYDHDTSFTGKVGMTVDWENEQEHFSEVISGDEYLHLRNSFAQGLENVCENL